MDFGADYTKSDERPSAITFRSVVMIVLITIAVVIILSDITRFIADWKKNHGPVVDTEDEKISL